MLRRGDTCFPMCRFTRYKVFLLLLCLGIVFGFVVKAHAGIRGPGKYCGVVVFDRWDTCFLLSGPYITYISDVVKNELRPYKGSAIQIDASDVSQPINPGDALVRRYKVIGPAPVIDHPPSLDSLELITQSDFSIIGAPAFRLEICNTGNKPVEVFSAEIGPAMLGKNNPERVFSPSDGSSVAWITRVDLALLPSEKSEWNKLGYSLYYADSSEVLPKRFLLQPGQSGKTRIAFKLPSGQYQFIFGYGGGVHEGRSLASNAVSFDVNDAGLATLASVSTTECLYVYAAASRCVMSLQK